MLELIRKYRAIFMIIFVLSAAGMIVSMFGAPGRRGGGSSGGLFSFDSGVAAKVDGDEISTQELAQVVNRQLEQTERMIMDQVQKSPNKAETRRFLEQMARAQITPDRMLEELIRQKFNVQTAESLGLTAPPDAIRNLIQKNPAFQNEGRFDPILYKRYVLEPGIYENELAMEAKTDAMRQAFDAGLGVVSDDEKKEDEALNKKFNFETLTVRPSTFPEPTVASSDDVKAFLARPDASAKMQAFYNRNIQKYQSAEQVHAKHILLKEAPDAQAKLQQIADDIKSGKTTFDAAAKANSVDKSNADKGGDLGFFGKGVMDPAFEAGAFALKDGELSKPIKSSFGWHLIQMVARKPAQNRSFESVKTELAPEVALAEKKEEKARAWIKEIASSGKSPSDADLKKMNLPAWQKAEWSPLESRLGSLSSIDENRKELLSLSPIKPMLSAPIMQGDSLVLVRYAAAAEAPKGKEAAKAPVARPPMDKAQNALSFFLRNRLEGLEKSKKIVRSERVLAGLRAQFNRSGPAPEQDDGG